ncbi:hypothetical protein DRW42_03555 [Pedobacter miscanthi]|uniref:Uncharacterized protein n=1 Tax=Pedobacter miscanthi TaxID=2259170 RepID=A0A366LCP0_9SPHI|nr:hypothetical protein DRW42_03555 [Pedobacter miscanthi]
MPGTARYGMLAFNVLGQFCEPIFHDSEKRIVAGAVLWKLRNYCLVFNRFFPTFVLILRGNRDTEKGTLTVPFFGHS